MNGPLAILRSADWEWALLFHVLGAFVLVGGLAAVVAVAAVAERADRADDAGTLRTLGLRTLVFAVLPAFVLMRLTAEWVRSEDPFPDEETWIGIGYMVADLGVPILIAVTVLAWLGARATRQGKALHPLTARIALALAAVYLIALLIAAWAMTAKPD